MRDINLSKDGSMSVFGTFFGRPYVIDVKEKDQIPKAEIDILHHSAERVIKNENIRMSNHKQKD